MLHGLFDLLLYGLIAVMLALSLLLAMVHYELAPALQLAGRRRWLLGMALGSGVLAFMIKLLIITTLVSLPQLTIDPLLGQKFTVAKGGRVVAEPVTDHYVWIELPGSKSIEETDVQSDRQAYLWQALPELAPSPVDNPMTSAKVALGEALFHDRNLSRDRTLSCASCHDLFALAGADGSPTALGIDHQQGGRNAPTVWNAAFQSLLFWDGRAGSLEEQAKGPLINPVEMGMPSLAAVEERVRQQAHYPEAFVRAFGDSGTISIERIAQAIAAYERSLITSDSPYDRFVRGDDTALSSAQLRGMNLFQSLGCINCHHGPNFSAASLFDDQMPRRLFPANPTPYEQRYNLVGDGGAAGGSGRGVWRVPSLRNVALTGPWLHNGSVTDLAEVVRIMASAQLGLSGHYLLWSAQDGRLREIDQPILDERQVTDIVAFLHALSSDRLVDRMAMGDNSLP